MSGRPEYALLSESGPDHAREFEVEVLINGESLGQGGGASKQQAEKEAAAEALAVLRTRLKQIDRGRAESSGDWQVAEREGGT